VRFFQLANRRRLRDGETIFTKTGLPRDHTDIIDNFGGLTQKNLSNLDYSKGGRDIIP
jgi:hypothetical protein